MKKVLSTALLAVVVAFYACGPSAEEKAKMEQAKQDSIAAVQKMYDDSVAAANAAVAEKARLDSMAMEQAKQDSMNAAAAKKGKK